MKPTSFTYRKRVRRWTPTLLTVAVLLLYAAFRSISLDDFDSYSFVLALGQFNLGLQQPQPPGFPVYIFLGRLLYYVTGNPTSALTWLSALSGVGTVVIVYAMGHLLDDDSPITGVLAALFVGLLNIVTDGF